MRREFGKQVKRRFLSKVEDRGVNECWPWTGRLDLRGYGRFDLDRKPELAHRVMYFLANPEANRSLVVCHECDNPPCCNPEHLWLGTQPQNVQDMDSKGRRKTATRRGEASNKAKLTAADAIYIYNSKESGPVLAARYGISKEAVNHIKRGRNWSSVTGGANAS